MTDVPPPARPRTNSQRRSRWRGSRPVDGSSSRRTAGRREQADRDVHPLLVTARERSDLIRATIAKARLVEHPLDRALDVVAFLEPGEEAQVLLDREAPVEGRLLRDPADLAGHAHAAGVRIADAGEDREQGRLAGPVRTDHGEELARSSRERDVVKGHTAAERMADALGFEHGRGRSIGRGAAHGAANARRQPSGSAGGDALQVVRAAARAPRTPWGRGRRSTHRTGHRPPSSRPRDPRGRVACSANSARPAFPRVWHLQPSLVQIGHKVAAFTHK